MTNKKPQIIQAISEMDILRLEELLDDNKTYQDATKQVFIEKVNEVFEKFKEKQDTQLISFSGSCNRESCTNNKGCKGLAFVGNTSNNAMNLIFNESENDFEDIFKCSEFKTNDGSINPIANYNIDIRNDEKANFYPTLEKLEIIEKCKVAYNQIINSSNNVLTNDKLICWLQDNYVLSCNNLFSILYRSVSDFTDLYNDLKDVESHIPFEISAFDAMTEFEKIDSSNDYELLNWLLQYENLHTELSIIDDSFESDGTIKNTGHYKRPKLKIDMNEFKNIIQFKPNFNDCYLKMYHKYKIFSNEELELLDENSEDFQNRFSLKYQIKKRGIQI
jgi:hypothetical protein